MDLSFLLKHSKDILEAITLVHAAALVIVNITPTPRDDEMLSSIGHLGVKVYRAIEMMAGIISPLVKR